MAYGAVQPDLGESHTVPESRMMQPLILIQLVARSLSEVLRARLSEQWR